MQQSESGIVLSSMRDIVYVLFRHKFKIVLFFLAIAAAVTAVTYALPVAYQSDSVLLMRIGRENLPGDPSVPGSALVNVSQDRTAEVKSEIAILTSHYLAERVVDTIGEGWILDRPELRREDVGIAEPPPPNVLRRVSRSLTDTAKWLLIQARLREQLTPYEESVSTVMRGLEVDVERQTNIINVSFEHKQPDVAQTVLDTLIDYYLDRHVEVFAVQAPPEFFEGQAAQLREELNAAENNLETFRRENAISSIEAQKETLLAQISVLEGELSDARAGVSGHRALVASLDEALRTRSRMHEVARTSGLPNFAADAFKERLIELRVEESELASRYTDNHRPLQDLRRQIDVIEDALAAEEARRTEVTVALDQNYEGLEHTLKHETAQRESQVARVAVLEESLDRYREELAAIADREVQLQRLARNVDLSDSEYRQYRENLQRARIMAALDVHNVSNVSVVQPASTPFEPVRPNKVRNIALGLLLGLFGGICLAFISEFMDDSLNTNEAVEKRLGVPVLASLSEKEFKACT